MPSMPYFDRFHQILPRVMCVSSQSLFSRSFQLLVHHQELPEQHLVVFVRSGRKGLKLVGDLIELLHHDEGRSTNEWDPFPNRSQGLGVGGFEWKGGRCVPSRVMVRANSLHTLTFTLGCDDHAGCLADSHRWCQLFQRFLTMDLQWTIALGWGEVDCALSY